MLNNFSTGGKLIGKHRTFIIAEIGSNHNQDINIAKKLIDIAVESGADAVKFQAIKYNKLYMKKDSDIKKKIELKEEWIEELFNYCNKKRILFFAAPTYLESIDILEKLDIKLYKIASPQTIAYPQIIKKIAKLKKPIIMSTGYCTSKEIDRAIKIVEKMGNKKLALLHCISEYPTKPECVNLKFIQTLKQAYNIPVGFSDHTLGWEITITSVALGANIIEKHITLLREQKGLDHFFSLEPNEFKTMIKNIRIIEKTIGDGMKLQITKNEKNILDKLRMKAIAKQDIFKGKKLNKKYDIDFRRDVNGIDAWDIYTSNNLIAKRNIKQGEPLTYEYIMR